MKIEELKAEYVFGTIPKLEGNQTIQCADFEKGEMRDVEGLTVGYLQRLISSENVKFYRVTRA